MSRFYLVLLLLCSQALWGQKQLAKLVAHADQQVLQQDYIEALDFYQKALVLEPTSLELLWKMAQAYQASKDYINGAKFYLKVYELDPEGMQFNEAQLNYALMLKQQSLYKEALAQFKEVKLKFDEDKSSLIYKKAAQEVGACNWVLKQLKNQTAEEKAPLRPHPMNTLDAEFGHAILNQELYFSALKPDSTSTDQVEVFAKSYRMQLFKVGSENRLQIALFELSAQNPKYSFGNISFNSDSSAFLCSACQELSSGLNCELRWAYQQTDGSWKLDTSTQVLPGLKASYISMPNLCQVNNEGQLLFCANLPDGKGGLDIYQATRKEDGTFGDIKGINALNSAENELSPWFDPLTNRLYFSSSWHFGYGGYDIFYSQLQTDGKFGPPINLGQPFNSPANDLYFFCVADTAYLSSNRIGSLYASHPTCCSDVFTNIIDRPDKKTTLKDSLPVQIIKLPIALYFENDCPDPKSKAEQTTLNYEETFVQYQQQFPAYLKGVQQSRDSETALALSTELQRFFDQEVLKGMQDLAIFREQVWQQLQQGMEVSILVQGFASPLAKSDYNVHLTKRRIDAIKNYFEEVDNGKFAAYMQGDQARLLFVEVPMGEFQAKKEVSDNYYDQRNSVYSAAASKERRIEIIELRSKAAKN
jgi:tetratricopeptide (TPR) repeat protein